jgi:NAD-dependent DNA ligase
VFDIKNLGKYSAAAVVERLPRWLEMREKIMSSMSIKITGDVSGPLNGTVWAFTGFRDEDCVAKIESLGGTYKKDVSGATTHLVMKSEGMSSAKLSKASATCEALSKDQMIAKLAALSNPESEMGIAP